MLRIKYTKQGFSLVEVIVALGIFSILAAGVFNVATSSYRNFYGTGDKQVVAEYGQEGIEVVRAIRDNAWQILQDASEQGAQGLVKDSNGYWTFSGSSDSLGSLTRTVTIEDVERNSNEEIVTSGGSDDPRTKKATVTISGSGIDDYVLTTYLTDWSYKVWEQTTWHAVGDRYYWTETNMASSSYSTTSTSTSGEITIAYDSLIPGFGDAYIYSSIYVPFGDERDLKYIVVEQDVPSGCEINITLETSNSSSFSPASTESHIFTGSEASYYVSSTPDELDAKNYWRYFVEMISCNIYTSRPVLESIKIMYK